jgi:hypothetical protein
MNIPSAYKPWGPWVARLIAESFVVILSVLLALALDEWRNNRELERQVQQTRAAFAEEIARNRDVLMADEHVPYHKAYWEHYKALTRAYNDEPAKVDSMHRATAQRFNTGVHPPPLRNAVWSSLAESDLVRRMDPDELFLLADIYREQEQLNNAFQRMLGVWMEPTPYRHQPAFQRDDDNITRIFMADVVAAEGRLLKRYEEGLALLRSK